MATLLSSTSWGVYIVEEENGQIVANTPGGIDLDNLTEGDTYIYLEDIMDFKERYLSQREGEDFLGFRTIQTGSTGAVSANTGGGYHHYFTITAKVSESTSQKLRTFFQKHVQIADNEKYLVHQRATTTFDQYPNNSGTLKNYCEVICRGVDITEAGKDGKDNKTVVLSLEECQHRN